MFIATSKAAHRSENEYGGENVKFTNLVSSWFEYGQVFQSQKIVNDVQSTYGIEVIVML